LKICREAIWKKEMSDARICKFKDRRSFVDRFWYFDFNDAGHGRTGLQRFAEVNAVNSRIIEKDWVKAEAANVINATTRANARNTMELLIADDATQAGRVKQSIEANKQVISAALDTLKQLIYLPEGQALLATLTERRTAYVASFSKVLKQIDAGDKTGAIQTMNSETLPALDALQEPIVALTNLQKKLLLTVVGKCGIVLPRPLHC
jgi:methyl-accepting chemotaxis protein